MKIADNIEYVMTIVVMNDKSVSFQCPSDASPEDVVKILKKITERIEVKSNEPANG